MRKGGLTPEETREAVHELEAAVTGKTPITCQDVEGVQRVECLRRERGADAEEDFREAGDGANGESDGRGDTVEAGEISFSKDGENWTSPRPFRLGSLVNDSSERTILLDRPLTGVHFSTSAPPPPPRRSVYCQWSEVVGFEDHWIDYYFRSIPSQPAGWQGPCGNRTHGTSD